MTKITITRSIEIPDSLKLARHQRSPELGPRILFFSGGTALKKLSQNLIRYTHNSVHLVTPFDSGGSSAALRNAFSMIAVGDIRNRLMALADQTVRGAPYVYELFSKRFSQLPSNILLKNLEELAQGNDPLIKKISNPMREIISYNLQFFLKKMPQDFPLQGANIGNLILVGGYLNYNCNIDSVIFIFSKLVEVRGTVRPIVNYNYHLAAELQSGQCLIGQHLITGKESSPIKHPISKLYLTKSLNSKKEVQVQIDNKTKNAILKAELICYPMGSFYSSLISHFLTKGTASAIAQNNCPKILILNYGKDPEQIGMNLSQIIETLTSYLQCDFIKKVSVSKLLNFVLLDSRSNQYNHLDIHIKNIKNMGIQIIDTPLITERSKPLIDENQLIDILLSFI